MDSNSLDVKPLWGFSIAQLPQMWESQWRWTQKTKHVSHCPQPTICTVSTIKNDIYHWHEWPKLCL